MRHSKQKAEKLLRQAKSAYAESVEAKTEVDKIVKKVGSLARENDRVRQVNHFAQRIEKAYAERRPKGER